MFCRNLFPENLVQACFQQVKTIYVEKKLNIIPPSGNESDIIATTVAATVAENATEAVVAMKRSLEFQDGMNVLGNYCIKQSIL